jgi:glutamyl-tRNA reductase
LLPQLGIVHITNRTDARAESLAQRTDARVLRWDGWADMLSQADVVVATARSAQPLITRAMADVAMSQRLAPATWIDLASPPNIAHDATVGRCVRRSLHDLPSQSVTGEDGSCNDPAQVALQHEVRRYAADRDRRRSFVRAVAAAPARMPATAA